MAEGAGLSWLLAIGVVLLVAAAALGIVLSALLERSGPIRLRHWAEESGGRLRALFDEATRFEVFRYALSLIARAAPVVVFAALLGVATQLLPAGGAATRVGLALAATLAILVAAETFNRLLVVRRSEAALRRLTWAYRAADVLLTPLVVPLAAVVPQSAIAPRDVGELDEASEEEIEAFLDVGAREGIIEPGEEDMFLRVIDFGDAQVKTVMTPRTDMVCAPVDSDLETLARLFLDSKHSRLPLFRESVDQIVGVLHIRDLLGGLRAAAPAAAAELVMTPFFVPQSKRLDELLRELQAGRQQMAIVVDEYGGTAGLVTVEDLLEEIVGEIGDEHEEVVRESERLADGRWRIDGAAELKLLGELFGIDTRDEPYDTVGGLIFGMLGSVPEEGSTIEGRGLRFTVERVEERRIQTVVVGPLGGSPRV